MTFPSHPTFQPFNLFQVQVLQHFTTTSGTVSLLGIRIFTGRQHQIRAHCAHVGHPSLTDGLLDEKTLVAFNSNARWLISAKTSILKPQNRRFEMFFVFPGPFFRFHVCFQWFVFEIGRFDFSKLSVIKPHVPISPRKIFQQCHVCS